MDRITTTSSLSTFLTNSLIKTLIQDLAIEEHKVASRRKYNKVSRLASTSTTGNGFLSLPKSTKTSTAFYRSSSPNGSPNKKEKDDGLYDCLNCSRSIGAPRYASHLSGCMGLSGIGGTRRLGGESRRAAASNGSARNGISRLGSERNLSAYPSDEEGPYLSSSSIGTSKHAIKIGSSIKRAASAQPPGSSKPKKIARSTTPLVPSSLSHPHPPAYSQPLVRTASAPILPHISSTLPRPPSAPPIVIRNPVVYAPTSTNAPSDRAESDDSSDDDVGPVVKARNTLTFHEAKQTLPPRTNGGAARGRASHPLSRKVVVASDSESEGETDSN